MSQVEPILQLKKILKDYPGVRAVNYASLELLPGEVHALVGENGAGKSTLIKIMAGVVQPDEGEIWLNGSPVHLHNGSEAYRLGLSFIHQERNLAPYLSGAENIFLGRAYPQNKWGGIDWSALYAQAQQILAQLGVHIPVDVPVRRLSSGDQAMISIGRAFAGEAAIFVMDEPTASLTDEEIHHLFRVIRYLRAQGHTILYVSHRLEEIFQICDRVTIMRDGWVVSTHKITEIDQAEMIRLMIGRELTHHYPPPAAAAGPPLLRVEGLYGKRVQNISFTVHAGEILGLAGLVGAGRTDILRMLYGAEPVERGEIWLGQTRIQPGHPAEAISQGIVLVPEERRSQGLVLNRSIRNNITLPHLKNLAWRGFILNPRRERTVSQRVSQLVRLKASSSSQKVSQLSGGNQQKVVFARWLVDDARLLLLDEPSRGVDVGARYEIYRLIRDLTAKGVGILLVSSDLNELLGLADRLLVLREGRKMAELNAKGLDQETVLRYCYGEA
ncbi:MAG: sugar ABC transporter ATP-binding protein [Chloroflexota bacterium]